MSWLRSLSVRRAPWASVWSAGSLAAALAISGCGTLNQAARSDDPFLDQSTIADDAAPAHRKASAANQRQGQIQQIQYEDEQFGQRPAIPPEAIQRTSGEARMPLVCPPGNPQRGCLPCQSDSGGDASDEYLCDGGDRNHPVHYEAGAMAGLDTQDAVAEFRDTSGRRRVAATNQVCVYSPRFAAVTAVTEPNENVTSDHLISSKGETLGGNLGHRLVTINHRQVDSPGHLNVRKRGTEIYTPVTRDELHGQARPAIHDTTVIAHNVFTYISTGVLIKEEEAWLATGIQNALTLTRKQYPVIQGHFAGLGEIKTTFSGSELVGREEPDKPGRLRISKLTDRSDVLPGDVITFTIRFDNLGDLPLSEVNIIDNLTPRLEYVPDSATLDREGELAVEDNGEGSLILRWKLAEPLPGHEGGTVTFQAKVR